MYYKTIIARRTGRKVKLVINEVIRDGEHSYFANVFFKDMDFFISLSPKETRMLCGQAKN